MADSETYEILPVNTTGARTALALPTAGRGAAGLGYFRFTRKRPVVIPEFRSGRDDKFMVQAKSEKL